MVKQPKYRVIMIVFASMALAGAAQSPNAMADTLDVDIVDSPPVFKTPDIEIKQGDSVRWIVKDGRTHRLKAVSPDTAFEETEDFDDTTERTFTNGGVKIDYECVRHPASMKGTITVK